MTKKTRTCLFFLCVFLYFLSAPSVVLYSQGYRLDWERKKIVKTGALYFKVLPKGAKVFLNGKFIKKTDFFFGSAFLENLLPRKYLVEIKKPGYQSWKKTLQTKEGQVTEAKNIVLLPKNLKLELLEKNIKDFFFLPNKTAMILKVKNTKNEKSWSLKLYDLKREIKSHLLDKEQISKNEVSLSNLILSTDEKRVILETEIKESPSSVSKRKFFLLNLDKNPPSLKDLDFLEGAKEVFFHPTDPQKLFFTKTKESSLALFLADLEKETQTPLLENILCHKVFQNYIFWISKEGFLEKSDFFGKSQRISSEPFFKKEGNLKIEIFNSQIFLLANNSLFLFDEDSKKFQKIADQIKSLIISPDSKKICFWSDNEIWIFFLKEKLDQPVKEKGEKLFLTRFAKRIENVFWYTSHYLIFNVDSEIKIIEIDDRDEIQIWDLTNFKDPKMYWNQKDKKLYILSKESLFVSEKLL